MIDQMENTTLISVARLRELEDIELRYNTLIQHQQNSIPVSQPVTLIDKLNSQCQLKPSGFIKSDLRNAIHALTNNLPFPHNKLQYIAISRGSRGYKPDIVGSTVTVYQLQERDGDVDNYIHLTQFNNGILELNYGVGGGGGGGDYKFNPSKEELIEFLRTFM